MLQFKIVKMIRTVNTLLTSKNGIDLLRNQYISIATKEIIPEKKSRDQIYKETKEKERAVEYISRKYSSENLSSDEIKLCLYSICDNNSYLRGSRDSVDKMIKFLKIHFKPDEIDGEYSLAISGINIYIYLFYFHNNLINNK